jgi:pimeloyl-[acyl-carrier protein] synthase
MIPGDASPAFMPQRDASPDDIYGYYARYRDAARVAWTEPEWPMGLPGPVLLRFEDVHAGLRDARLGKEWRRLLPPGQDPPPPPPPGTFGHVAANFMLFRDPPDHTRLRSTANMAFTPRRVRAMRDPVERLTNQLVADLATASGPVDLIAQFAYPLPVLVIAGILGIPDEDYERFRDWANVIAAAIDLPVDGLQAFASRADQVTAELTEYLGWIVAQRREDPRDDLISTMIAAETTEGRINEDELIATLILLLVAGHETTVNVIGNGMLAVLQHRDQWQALVDDPSLARNATEELLRYDSPVQMTTRLAMEDLEVAGVTIPRGANVYLVLGSANRDPEAFPNPDQLDIRRDVGRIMSFGMGIHFCLGSPLARLEGELAFAALARELPGLELAGDRPAWRPGLILRGLRDLPVTTGG